MNDLTDTPEQPIRPAATVIIARPAEPQFEIFMLKRTSSAVFAGGMYVFPGGKVDEQDAASHYLDKIVGPSPAQQSQKDALGDDWQSYWIAGIRETFEEAGLMLAYDASGDIVTIDHANNDSFERHRAKLNACKMTLNEICDAQQLKLAFDKIHFFNRFITPPARPRRFDTRFFITEAPEKQLGSHDGEETTDSCWISPAEAIRRSDNDEFGLMRVTKLQLSTINACQSLEDLLTMASENTDFPTFHPSTPRPGLSA